MLNNILIVSGVLLLITTVFKIDNEIENPLNYYKNNDLIELLQYIFGLIFLISLYLG
jgi:hypothetical protein